MNQDPFNQRFEELITDELCRYQSRLNQGVVGAPQPKMGSEIPNELQSAISECQRCLDLLHETRTFGGFPLRQSKPPEPPKSGRRLSRIGRFETVEILGVGGFGIVYRGIDPIAGREVAIKIPRPEFLGLPELTERFSREASIVAKLDHPNIVTFYECNCFEVVPYIVMPFFPGKTLSEWLANGREVSPRIAAETVRQLALAVAHAHERGVLHRDIKPKNVLLANPSPAAAENELPFIPKLTDFGLAKWTDLNLSDTQRGAVIGTAGYFSPEQAEGRKDDITERSDVYGLGAILYEMLTGKPPFHENGDSDTSGSDNDTYNGLNQPTKVSPDNPAAPLVFGRDVPRDLQSVCLKCLENDPADRYQSANALAEDLQRVLLWKPTPIRPVATPAPEVKRHFRRTTPATLIVAVLIGLLSTAFIVIRFNRILNKQIDIAESARLSARISEQRADLSELELRKKSYVADMRNAKLSLDHGNLRQTLNLLDRYHPAPEEEDVRNFAWWQMWREIDESSRILGTHEKGCTAVAVTRKGNLVASGGADSTIRLWSLPAGELIAELIGHELGPIESLDFSPTGERLVSAGEDGSIRVWDVATCKELFVRKEHFPVACHAIYSPKGDLIASAGADQMIRLWDPETGAPLATLEGHSKKVRCLAFHPTEPTLVSGGLDDTIRFWNLAGLSSANPPKDDMAHKLILKNYPRALAFEPNGNSLLAATIGAEVLTISLKPSQYGEIIHKTAEATQPRALIWPQESEWIVGLRNSKIRFADSTCPEDTLQSLSGHFGTVLSIAAPAHCAFLVSASADGTVRYWPQVKERTRIPVTQNEIAAANPDQSRFSVQWSDRYLAADLQQQQVALYQMPEKQLVRTIRKNNDDSYVISPSGNLLLTCQPNGLATCFRADDGFVLWTLLLPSRHHEVHGPSAFAAIDRLDRIAIVACQNELLVVSTETADVLQRLKHPEALCQVALLESGEQSIQAVSTCSDGLIRFWDLHTGQLLRQCPQGSSHTFSLAISSDHQLLATGSHDGLLRVWKLDDLSEVAVNPLPSKEQRFDKLAFLNGSKILVHPTTGLRLWSVAENAELSSFSDVSLFGSFAVSPDGNQLAIHQHGSIYLIDGTPQVRDVPEE